MLRAETAPLPAAWSLNAALLMACLLVALAIAAESAGVCLPESFRARFSAGGRRAKDLYPDRELRRHGVDLKRCAPHHRAC
jgi:hypothetical protein